jgi:hypothetical protein
VYYLIKNAEHFLPDKQEFSATLKDFHRLRMVINLCTKNSVNRDDDE